MKQAPRYRSSSFGYVEVKSFPHYGEKAVPYRGFRVNDQGEAEREFILLDCKHGEHTVWLKRNEI